MKLLIMEIGILVLTQKTIVIGIHLSHPKMGIYSIYIESAIEIEGELYTDTEGTSDINPVENNNDQKF